VFNDAGADVDFRVEGDTDANLLFVNAGNDRVGIGTGSPISKLSIVGGNGNQLLLDNTGQRFTQIDFAHDGNVEGRVWYDDTNNLMAFSGTSGKSIGFFVNGSDANSPDASIDSSANFSFNSGYGSNAVAYGCRAWVNFDGTGTVAIREDGNVSSITDNGTGLYTLNFATAMPDANYSVAMNARNGSDAFVNANIRFNVAPTTSALAINTGSGIFGDADYVTVAVFR
jgi:hypothetical protein